LMQSVHCFTAVNQTPPIKEKERDREIEREREEKKNRSLWSFSITAASLLNKISYKGCPPNHSYISPLLLLLPSIIIIVG
jgi:hypothetical protein